jgi:hypothetical protein
MIKKVFIKNIKVPKEWSHKTATESEAIIKAERNEHYHYKEHLKIHKNAFENVKKIKK